jgi:hypothetical protein
MGKYLKTKPGSLESAVLEAVSPKSVEEKIQFSPKEIKMAIGVASDPRYKGGNYSGAYNAIEKIKKGLGDHPQVAAVLKRQNESAFNDAEVMKKYYDDKKIGLKKEGTKEEYEKFFKSALKKFGVESPADFKSDEEKKKFFDYIDKNYEGEDEKSEAIKEDKSKVKKSLVEMAAEHIANLWKEANKSKFKSLPEEEICESCGKVHEGKCTKEDSTGAKTMTGKPLSKVEVSPKSKED